MKTPKSIVILGGGTAGWMAAAYLSKVWQNKSIKISLIESSRHKTLGVGEGSTPFLRDFFSRLGIDESFWMTSCDATFKHGIAFPNWTKEGFYSSYFHPFYNELDSKYAPQFFNNCRRNSKQTPLDCLPDDYFISSYLATFNKTPKLKSGADCGIDYGYHFDAGKLVDFLKSFAVSQGVTHINDEMTNAYCVDRKIESIDTLVSGNVKADFFIDCSGSKGLLIQNALNTPFIDYSQYLPNNSAVAIQTPLNVNSEQSNTSSEAVENGWVWHIPLKSRKGNGLVYSNKYLSEQEAEQQLRSHLNEYKAPANHLYWNIGRVERHWSSNCLALGMSQGFLEPLEAPMLNMVQQTIESFHYAIDTWGVSSKAQSYLNTSINKLFDGTCDYLQAHYLTNSRDDSQYWIDNQNLTYRTNFIPELIQAWKQSNDIDGVLQQYADQLAYGKTSWYCLLSGMLNKPLSPNSACQIGQTKHQQMTKELQNMSQCFLECERFVGNTHSSFSQVFHV